LGINQTETHKNTTKIIDKQQVDPDEAKVLGRPWTRRYVYNHAVCGRCRAAVKSWDMANRTVYCEWWRWRSRQRAGCSAFGGLCSGVFRVIIACCSEAQGRHLNVHLPHPHNTKYA
jgi:hypothetical protein